MAAPAADRPPVPWPPYTILPSILDGREAHLVSLRELADGSREIAAGPWPLSMVAITMMARAHVATMVNPKLADVASRPHDGHLLAGRAKMTAWRDRFFVKPLREYGTAKDFHERAAVSMWAVDQLLEYLGFIEKRFGGPGAVNLPKTSAWRKCIVAVEGDLPSWMTDDKKRAERIARLASNIKPGAAPALMADLLDEAIVVMRQQPA